MREALPSHCSAFPPMERVQAVSHFAYGSSLRGALLRIFYFGNMNGRKALKASEQLLEILLLSIFFFTKYCCAVALRTSCIYDTTVESKRGNKDFLQLSYHPIAHYTCCRRVICACAVATEVRKRHTINAVLVPLWLKAIRSTRIAVSFPPISKS